jgi:hypothetical protein
LVMVGGGVGVCPSNAGSPYYLKYMFVNNRPSSIP